MSTVDNIISECFSTDTPEENSPVRPQRQRTLRRDLSHDGPREFRHINRLNSEVATVTCEKQQSSNFPEFDRNIIHDIHRYFSGLNSPYLHTCVQPPTVRLTRRLTKGDITPPINFRHIAHIDYHEVSKNFENMSRKQCSDSTCTDPAINTKENLTKDDISYPTDFRHVAHIGVDDNQLRMNTEDTIMKLSIEKPPEGQQHERRKKRDEIETVQKKTLTKEDIGYPENFQHLVHIDFQNAFNAEKIFEEPPVNNVDTKATETQSFISDITDENPKSTTKPIPKPRSFKKKDIEIPQDFRHNAHISYNKDKPVVVNENDVVLKNFFKKAGVTQEHLMDEETRNFIFEFVRQHSQLGGARNDIQQIPISDNYKDLAQNLQSEADTRSREEYLELLLTLYRRNVPL